MAVSPEAKEPCPMPAYDKWQAQQSVPLTFTPSLLPWDSAVWCSAVEPSLVVKDFMAKRT